MDAKGVCAVAAFVIVGVLVAFSGLCIALKRHRRVAAASASETSDSSLWCDTNPNREKSTFSYTSAMPPPTRYPLATLPGDTRFDNPDEICPICLGKYVDGDVLEELSCSHAYHEECIERRRQRHRLHSAADSQKTLKTTSFSEYSVSSRKMAEELACAICLEDFSPEDALTELHCGHAYHSKCIEKWMSFGNGQRCPSCREKIVYVSHFFITFDDIAYTELLDPWDDEEDVWLDYARQGDITRRTPSRLVLGARLVARVAGLRQRGRGLAGGPPPVGLLGRTAVDDDALVIFSIEGLSAAERFALKISPPPRVGLEVAVNGVSILLIRLRMGMPA
ncbi:hypothetical protein FOL47_008990 [Perkinsus chesapeaki]|uniref:RING-type domain-containing protein n=1 Tax=Perkinsus chesapeaki TaxID=330153 RepID=A0A7J6MSL4_PERCH|nr:hypothetical protein FOL47_008990 [Perkinsus chesapeaki]